MYQGEAAAGGQTLNELIGFCFRVLETLEKGVAPNGFRHFFPGKGAHFDDADTPGQAFRNRVKEGGRTGTGDDKPASFPAMLIDRHAECREKVRKNLSLVNRYLPGIEPEEQVRVVGDQLEIGAALEVIMLPSLRQYL